MMRQTYTRFRYLGKETKFKLAFGENPLSVPTDTNLYYKIDENRAMYIELVDGTHKAVFVDMPSWERVIIM